MAKETQVERDGKEGADRDASGKRSMQESKDLCGMTGEALVEA